MHEAIVDGVNSRVAKNDELYVLGDISFYGATKVCDILERINGRKHFIIGNHDAKNMKNWSGWVSVSHYKELSDSGQKIILMHYPIESWNKMTHGSIHLHGHRHGVKNDHPGFREDVGVDVWDFKPVCLSDLTAKWLKQGKIV